MSKQFEAKKEAAARLRKYLSSVNDSPAESGHDSEAEYKLKYNLLLRRFNELEKIFDFHRSVTQNISSGIMTVDFTGKITFMNRAALDMFGYGYLEIQGQNVALIFANEHEASNIIGNAVNGNIMYESKESYFIDKNKQVFPVGFTTSLLKNTNSSEVEGLIFTFRNIKTVSYLRKQIERMDRLATLGELAAGIAHEIRNPLAGIKASAQVLEESFSPGDFRSQLVTRIVKEIDRSNELLKRFFNFARPSKPKQDSYNIEMIIDGVYLLLAPRLKKNKIGFRSSFAADTPQVFVDESQMEQVILNLFMNAIDAMKEGGEIFVETGVIPEMKLCEEKEKRAAVYVRITDTGAGIPSEKLEKIFNPFYTTKSDGVGLGLSISNRLLEENGGKIEVDSKAGNGAAFTLYLPVIKA